MAVTIPAERLPLATAIIERDPGGEHVVVRRSTVEREPSGDVRLKIAALFAALAFAVLGCIHASQPDADQMARDVKDLKASFSTLEALRLSGFRDQDWCRFIDYPRGAFTSLPVGDDSDTCNLFDGAALPFDDQASADFERVRAALAGTGVRGDSVLNIQHDDAGHMRTADFDLNGGSFDRWTYVFDRGGSMPENEEGEELYTRINEDWYFWWEDWN
jgi:hypothetical protein